MLPLLLNQTFKDKNEAEKRTTDLLQRHNQFEGMNMKKGGHVDELQSLKLVNKNMQNVTKTLEQCKKETAKHEIIKNL